MIAVTQAQTKRSKPRRQSGEAVKGIQKADLLLKDLARIDDRDLDRLRMRRRVLLLETAVAEEESSHTVCYGKRSKPRRQIATGAADYKHMKETQGLTFLNMHVGLQPMSL